MRHKKGFAFLFSAVTFFISFANISAVTIDNQVTIIKNDCFERQAIGYRLKASDVYKTLDVKTVPECQRECTKEEDTCKTFSFGIGVKGNSSCELSKRVIRETADLKPIGTLLDEDFDLYIKKLGCKLVIEQKPSSDVQPQSDEIPSGTLGTVGTLPKPQFDGYDHQRPEPGPRPSYNHPDSGPNDGGYSKPPRNPHGTLQTSLISVRPDPSRPGYTGLSAALTAAGSGGYDGPSRPSRPTRPVNEPLNERPVYAESGRPRPDFYGGGVSNSYVNEIPERPSYGSGVPDRPSPSGLYEGQSFYGGGSNSRPYKPYKPPRDPLDNDLYYNRPELTRPDFRPGVGYYRPIDPMMDEFKPNFDNLRPESWGGYERPDPMRDPIPSYEYGMSLFAFQGHGSGSGSGYGSGRPSYETRPQYERPERPFSGYYRPTYDDHNQRPSYSPEMEFSRPGRPQYEYGNGYRPEVPPDFRPDVRPSRPVYEDLERPFDRPDRPERPERPGPGSEAGYRPGGQRPSDFRPPPDYTDERPGPGPGPSPDYTYERPQRPRPDFDRPSNSYERPNQYKPNWDKDTINRPYDSSNPNVNYDNVIKPVTEDSSDYGNRRQDNFGPGGKHPQRNSTKYGPNPGQHSGVIVSESLGPNGEKITSIITEIQAKPGLYNSFLPKTIKTKDVSILITKS